MITTMWIMVIACAAFYVRAAYFTDKYEQSDWPLFWYFAMILSCVLLIVIEHWY